MKRHTSQRRRLAREKLEITLVYLMLMYRPLALVLGLLLALFAALVVRSSPAVGVISLGLAAATLLLNSSFRAVQAAARAAAWLGTLGSE